MTRPTNYAAMAQFLQSASSIRLIEFKDGGFFCGDDEVTGREYIVDFRKLHFGRIARDEGGTFVIHEDKSLWDYSTHELTAINAVATGRAGDTPADRALMLALEDRASGAFFLLVLHGPDGWAAIGRLCNLYRRHPDKGDAIVRLNVAKQKRTVGIAIKIPELSLANWEGCYRYSNADDDIPF